MINLCFTNLILCKLARLASWFVYFVVSYCVPPVNYRLVSLTSVCLLYFALFLTMLIVITFLIITHINMALDQAFPAKHS